MRARAVAAGTVVLVVLLACVKLFRTLTAGAGGEGLKVLGLKVPPQTVWPAALFVVLAGLAFLVTFGPSTGIEGLDRRIRKFIDLLIDTESELSKVSWPSREQLVSSTTAVLVCIVLLSAFIFCVDWLVAFVLRTLNVF